MFDFFLDMLNMHNNRSIVESTIKLTMENVSF